MLSSSPMGQRGTAPEATSVVLFVVVAMLLWFALGRAPSDVRAAESPAGQNGALGATEIHGASTVQR